MRRAFLLVLDSVGVGHAPDADAFGDAGADTLRAAYETGELFLPNLCALGLGRVPGVDYLPVPHAPLASVGALVERSAGKDTTTGHWELAGLVSHAPMPTFGERIPEEVMRAVSDAIGYPLLCGLPYSGTKVIADYGREHLARRAPIAYTSADSVFQIACHTDIFPTEELYRICRIAREVLCGEYGVGRVIARPFSGEYPDYVRTADRRDFSLVPPAPTVLDAISAAGLDVIGVGKISDIFAGRGLTESYPDHGNVDCMARTLLLAEREFHGLAFVNLVDFDMVYGHRNDPVGYARALNAFDASLGELLPKLGEEDLLIITADHGCDPSDESTDHTRERVPFLVCGGGAPCELGVRAGFDTAAELVAEHLCVRYGEHAL